MQKHKSERRRRGWREVLWHLLILIGVRTEAIKASYASEILEEIERKRRRERNKSQLERELDMAK